MKILLVDYSLSLFESTREMLFETGNIIYLHKDVSYAQAIGLYKKIYPDFVLLDICRGSDNSFKISKEIREQALKKYIIILAVEDGNYVHKPSNSHGVYLFFDKYSEFEKCAEKLFLP